MRPTTHRLSGRPQRGQRRRGVVGGRGVQHQVAEAVDSTTWATSASPSCAARRSSQPHEHRGVERLAGVGQRLAGGQLGGDRGEDVAAVERGRHGLEPPWRAETSTASVHAAEALRRRQEQPVVRADEQPVLAPRTQRRPPAGARRPRVDDREVDAGGANGSARASTPRPRAHVLRRHAVAQSMTRAVGHSARDHGVDDADELVARRRSRRGT